MKKVRDVFYDMNDILVAVIVIIIAAFVIVTNIGTILDFPSSIAEEIQVPEEKPKTTYAEAPSEETSPSGIEGSDSSKQTENGEEPVKYAVYIEYGATADKVADLMISVGLMETRQEFYDAMNAAGAEGKLKAGNFIIPSDSTPAEVIKILTK